MEKTKFTKRIVSNGTEYEIIHDAELDNMTLSFRASVDKAIANSLAKGNPIAKWDNEKKAAYFYYPDGHREYRHN